MTYSRCLSRICMSLLSFLDVQLTTDLAAEAGWESSGRTIASACFDRLTDLDHLIDMLLGQRPLDNVEI